jgi:hypothetical protein
MSTTATSIGVVHGVVLDLVGGPQENPARPNRTPGSLGFAVYDGLTDPPSRDIVRIDRKLPYAVFYGAPGLLQNPRLTGRRRGRSEFWSFTYVGGTRTQALWACRRIRAVLEDQRLDVPGMRTGLVEVQASDRIRRDDDAIHSDGSPLFYGFDDYALPIYL